MTQHRITLYWFRRALRLDDNRGLSAALAASERVVPCFVVDPSLLARPDIAPVRVRFLFEGLALLDRDLRRRGSRLIVREGDPAHELPRLARECRASAVFHAREYEPFGRERDARVAQALAALGVAVETHEDHLAVAPGAIRTKAGGVHRVFAPYLRRWREEQPGTPLDPPERLPDPGDLASAPLPQPPACSATSPQAPGEAAAHAALTRFLDRAVDDYETQRHVPAVDGTAQLSAALRFGMISVRRIVAQARRRVTGPGVDAFLAQLAWRDFYYQVLAEYPYVADGAFHPALRRVRWENDERLFAAWREGRTGFAWIDAGMRQLQATGWMPNRVRMACASFLCKELGCDWRWGEAHFMTSLVDGDLAANNGGWQWVAGTGVDAAPYFRIFDPVAQAARFDPGGAYVRRWAPERSAPLIDRAARRVEALHRYRQALEEGSRE